MDTEKLKERILALAPDAVQEENKQFATFVIPAEKFHSVIENLKNSADTAFDYLFCLTGVDFGKELGVVYHLNSTSLRHNVELKVKTEDRVTPKIDSVTDLYRAAEFYEREVYDLLGINFTNHPDMRRIFLDESWVGYPLRKDYIDEINIVEL
ncbi:MAG: NADH-quinone oxidoreductase subunit C [Bacteroidota bacterium]